MLLLGGTTDCAVCHTFPLRGHSLSIKSQFLTTSCHWWGITEPLVSGPTKYIYKCIFLKILRYNREAIWGGAHSLPFSSCSPHAPLSLIAAVTLHGTHTSLTPHQSLALGHTPSHRPHDTHLLHSHHSVPHDAFPIDIALFYPFWLAQATRGTWWHHHVGYGASCAAPLQTMGSPIGCSVI